MCMFFNARVFCILTNTQQTHVLCCAPTQPCLHLTMTRSKPKCKASQAYRLRDCRKPQACFSVVSVCLWRILHKIHAQVRPPIALLSKVVLACRCLASKGWYHRACVETPSIDPQLLCFVTMNGTHDLYGNVSDKIVVM